MDLGAVVHLCVHIKHLPEGEHPLLVPLSIEQCHLLVFRLLFFGYLLLTFCAQDDVHALAENQGIFFLREFGSFMGEIVVSLPEVIGLFVEVSHRLFHLALLLQVGGPVVCDALVGVFQLLSHICAQIERCLPRVELR